MTNRFAGWLLHATDEMPSDWRKGRTFSAVLSDLLLRRGGTRAVRLPTVVVRSGGQEFGGDDLLTARADRLTALARTIISVDLVHRSAGHQMPSDQPDLAQHQASVVLGCHDPAALRTLAMAIAHA